MSLRVSLDKVKPRERVVLALLSFVVTIYLSVLSWETAVSRIGAAKQAQAALRSATDPAQQRRARVLLAFTNEQTRVLRPWFFEDANLAIARVVAQAELERLAQDAGISGARVLADAEAVGDGRIKTLGITVEGAFEWASFLAFLEAVSRSEKSIFVTAIAVEGRPTRFRLSAVALLGNES